MLPKLIFRGESVAVEAAREGRHNRFVTGRRLVLHSGIVERIGDLTGCLGELEQIGIGGLERIVVMPANFREGIRQRP